jgi:hypothetical protein
MTSARATATSRDVRAGCFVCYGSDARWIGGQAQGTAAQHHDATGHATWCDVYLSVRYGRDAGDDRQIDIEESIAASARSGGEPVATPLTDPDAPTVAPVRVSVPSGRSVETSAPKQHGARGRKPETAHA